MTHPPLRPGVSPLQAARHRGWHLPVLVCLALLSVMGSVAGAMEVWVSPTGSATTPCGPQTNPCRLLSSALAVVTPVGGTIHVLPGGVGHVYSAPSTMAVTTSITIVGVGSPRPIIQCSPGVQAFTVGGTVSLTLVNVAVQGCGSTTATQGAVITASGSASVNLTNSLFMHNRAVRGGVVRAANNAHVTVWQSTFQQNFATTAGGVVVLDNAATMTVLNSDFGPSSAAAQPFCSAVPDDPPPESLCDGTLQLFNATTGFIAHARTMDVDTSVQCRWLVTVPPGTGVRLDFCPSAELNGLLFFFEPCTTTTVRVYDGINGNLLYLGCGTMMPVTSATNTLYFEYDAPDGRFEDADFVLQFSQDLGNTVPWQSVGGTVSANDQSQLTVQSSRFVGQSGGWGGAISAAGSSQIVITSTNFTAGFAQIAGGAVHTADTAQATVTSCLFSHMRAISGGALASRGTSHLTTLKSTCSDSTAYQGGCGVALNSSVLTLQSTTMQRNSANAYGGCVISFNTSTVNAVASQFVDNFLMSLSPSFGAGFYVTDHSNCHLTNCLLARNSVQYAGGALGLAVYGYVNAVNTQFVNNTCRRWGGVAFLQDTANFTMVDSIATGNTATDGRGGVLMFQQSTMEPGSVHFLRSNFTRNQAVQTGGVMHLVEGVAYVSQCVFSRNSATGLGGGVLVADYGTIVAQDSLFIGNSAAAGSGAVFFVRLFGSSSNQQSCTFTRCKFFQNTAYHEFRIGGAFYIEGSVPVVLDRCEFAYSSAVGGAVAYIKNAAPFLAKNCYFHNNRALPGVSVSAAGAVIAASSDFDPMSVTLRDCVFSHNVAGPGPSAELPALGGALYLSQYVSMDIQNCTFANNQADQGGVLAQVTLTGGDSVKGATVAVTNSMFLNNVASSNGGVFQINSEPSTPVQFSLNNVTVANSNALAGGAMYASGAVTLQVTGSSMVWGSASTSGGALYLTKGVVLTMKHSTLSNNLAADGGAVTLDQSVTLAAEYATFTNNSALLWGDGGAFQMGRHTVVTCSHCQFIANTAGDGGVFFTELDALVTVNNSLFMNNLVRSDGGVMISTSSSPHKILNSVIVGNSAVNGGVVSLHQNAVVVFSNVSVSASSAVFGGVAFVSSGAVVTFTNSKLTNNQAAQSGGLAVMYVQARMLIQGCSATSNVARQQSGLIDLSGTATVSIAQTNIHGCQADSGGVITAHESATVTITSSSVTSTVSGAGGVSLQDTSRGSISNTVFYHNGAASGAVLYLTHSATAFVSNITARGNVASGPGGVFYADTKSQLTVVSSTLHSNVGGSGGAGWFSNKALVTMSKLSFVNNSAAQAGGALAVSGTSIVTVNASDFIANKALEGGALSVTSGSQITVSWAALWRHMASWGGVAYVSDAGSTDVSAWLKLKYCSIQHNFATEGGGIMYVSLVPNGQFTRKLITTFLQNANLYNNTGAQFGNMVASNPVRLSVLNPVVTVGCPQCVRPVISGEIVKNPLDIVGVDGFDQQITGADILLLISASGDTKGVNSSVVYGQTLSGGNKGFARFDAMSAEGFPGTVSAITFSAIQPTSVQPGTALIYFTPCVNGQVLSSSGTRCQYCSSGFYSYWPSQPCMPCPAHAVCPGANLVVAQTSYWRATPPKELVPIFVKCTNAQACRGAVPYAANVTSDDEGCAVGYQGRMCGGCSEGYAHSDRLSCAQCASYGTNLMILILVLLAAVSVTVVVVQIQRHIGQKGMDVMTMVVKILASYYQFVSVANSLDVLWPGAVRQVFSVQNSITSLGGHLMFLDCLFRDLDWRNDFFTMSVVYLSIAPAMVVLCAAFWGTTLMYRRYCRRRERRTPEELKRITLTNFTVTCIVVLFLMHPSITEKVVEMVTCVRVIPDSSDYYLQADPDVQCYTSTHLYWLGVVALPAFVLIVVGVPLSAFLILRSMRSKLEDPFVQSKYGFLYLGYAPACYYWEIVIVARKMGIILAAELLAQFGFTIQILGAVIVTFVSYVTHAAAQPYANLKLDRLDKLAILISLGTFSLGAFLEDTVPLWAQVSVTIVIIAGNGLFLLYLTVYVRAEILLALRDAVSDVSSVLQCVCQCSCCFKQKRWPAYADGAWARPGQHVDNPMAKFEVYLPTTARAKALSADDDL